MPLSNYDRIVSPAGKKNAAAKAHAEFIKQYGLAQGTKFFYAWLNERKAKMRRGSRSS